MKYSILMPYYNRADVLRNTLVSFRHHYGDRADYEIIIALDYKTTWDKKENIKVGKIQHDFRDLPITVIDTTGYPDSCCPAAAFNQAAKVAQGKYLMLTNPECFHKSNILMGIGYLIGISQDDFYYVCACESAKNNSIGIQRYSDFKYEHNSWYQHAVHRPAYYHFCSVISAKNYWKIGGFDEDFMHGVSYEDDDFRDRIIWNKIPIISVDTLVAVHQWHEPFDMHSAARKPLSNHNRDLFYTKKKERESK